MFLLSLCLAAPPEFTVVNRTAPAFQVVNKTKAPEVVKPKAATFRESDWHPGHDCPRCGRQQLQLSGGSVRGVHSHTCRFCGTTWRHAG